MIPIAKPYVTKDEAQSAYDTILSGWLMQGPVVEEFEKKFCDYTGAKYAVAVSSGTTALHLSLITAGIKKGDEVIVPSLSHIATANCVRYQDAVPVFAEINPQTYNIDSDNARKLITEKTKAILIAHQIGMPADIDSFKKICLEKGLMLIEDAACAIGSMYKGKQIGVHSELVCFSFHPRKVITTGEGGMIATSNEEYYERLRYLRQQGLNEKVRYTELGFNYRMTDIQAAIGLRQLEKLDWIVNERRKIAKRYIEGLKNIDSIKLPEEDKGYYSNYQSFCIYLKGNSRINRKDLLQKLLEDGIAAKEGIMTCHREAYYKNNFGGVKLPISEDVSDSSLLLPLYVTMNESDIEFIVSKLKLYLE